MQKVITINLNGNAYQIEEAGYGALVGYLDGAQRQLRDRLGVWPSTGSKRKCRAR